MLQAVKSELDKGAAEQTKIMHPISITHHYSACRVFYKHRYSLKCQSHGKREHMQDTSGETYTNSQVESYLTWQKLRFTDQSRQNKYTQALN